MPKLNPFRPGSVISPGMFVGRIEEIELVEQSLLRTREANPQHFIIEGERGIGKSSLCLWVDYLARGDITYDGTNRLSFVVVNTDLHAAMAYDDIVDAIMAELKRQLIFDQNYRCLAAHRRQLSCRTSALSRHSIAVTRLSRFVRARMASEEGRYSEHPGWAARLQRRQETLDRLHGPRARPPNH